MISKESTPQPQIAIQRQIVGLSNGASYFPCISHKWDMNFTLDVEIHTVMVPLWFAQKKKGILNTSDRNWKTQVL